MCREGGCGSCIVSVKSSHPTSGMEDIRSVNSCLVPLFSCDGLDITTVEALGNYRDGYSAIQDSLVKFGGTQCGYCSPGFVMNMHSIAQANPKFTSEDVEQSLDGNICRCTGFRPILDAFKALSVNPPESLKRNIIDIEELPQCPLKKSSARNRKISDESFEILHQPSRNLYLESGTGQQWFKVTSLSDLFEIIGKFSAAQVNYKLVAGNTGTGVFKNDGPYDGFIDINDIPELSYSNWDKAGLVLGGGTTLTSAMELFKRVAQTPEYSYAEEFHRHFQRIACHSVRNRGTLAGNLMLKHLHKEFNSDVFLLFEAVGATLRIGSSTSLYEQYSLEEFLKTDMSGKVILWIYLAPLPPNRNFLFRSFKLGKRHQNTSAYVNAAFLLEIDERTQTILDKPRICYGGINPDFIHASLTEDYLKGKPLTLSTLQKALRYLEHEIMPDSQPHLASPEYRLRLAQSFFYKVFLQALGNNAASKLRSGAYEIERLGTHGQQDFETDPSKFPLGQPIPKIESYYQVSGEAKYINDRAPEHNELHGVFVVSTVGNAKLGSVDATEALNVKGVVAFITAKDVPGLNSFSGNLVHREEIFATSDIKYAGTPIGLLVAKSRQIALEARSKVIVKYENIAAPILDVAEAVNNLPKNVNQVEELRKCVASTCLRLDKQVANEVIRELERKQNDKVDDTKTDNEEFDMEVGEPLQTVKGEVVMRGQYHFFLETQVCICVPREGEIHLYPSTQGMDFVQFPVAAALNIPHNKILIEIKRLGGGFGGKSARSALTACAAAVAAHKLNRPVRVLLDLETNMQMLGKRLPYLATYEAKVDSSGRIRKLEGKAYCDAGSIPNEPDSLYATICVQSCYKAENWNLTPGVVTTNTATNTFCRSPGSSNGVGIIETIMDHVAYTVKRDPLEVRKINFIEKGDPFLGVPGAKLKTENPLPKIIDDLTKNVEFYSRRKLINEFNQTNRWKKRGIAVVPQRYPNYYWDFRFPTFISVYPADGTVNVSHAGIEMGQGLNSKVAQVVAYTLEIPIEKVRVTQTNNIISTASAITGGSVASELVCSSARRACQELLKKLEPVRSALNNPTWEQLIVAANAREILLTAHFQERNGDVESYDVWGVTVTEVEIDVLTGDYKIVRVDLLEDAGDSLSPLIDIGQIEGAFVMGLSWWLTEELIYDKTSGVLLTDNSWSYKPMLAGDLPEDFRVSILRNAPNPFGVLSSKATGEPPLNMSVSVVNAIRHAIDSARRDAGNNAWYQMDGPITREVVRGLCLAAPQQFTV